MSRTCTWVGGTSNKWNLNANWSGLEGGEWPGYQDEGWDHPTDDNVILPSTGVVNAWSVMDDAAVMAFGPSIGSLTIESGYSGSKGLPCEGNGDSASICANEVTCWKASFDFGYQQIMGSLTVRASGVQTENATQYCAAMYFYYSARYGPSYGTCHLMANGVLTEGPGAPVLSDTDPPAVGDVEDGVFYENGTKEGTLAVPVQKPRAPVTPPVGVL